MKGFGKVRAVIMFVLVLIGLSSFKATGETHQTNAAKNIILVHGAWADGSSWSKVIPLLEARGLHVVAVQLPLTSLADDVATVKRAIERQDGPVLLVGHSYGGAVITEAGNDNNVVGLVYVAAFAPAEGESVSSISSQFPPPPIAVELRADPSGFVSVTQKGIWEDFAQDLSDSEKQLLTATQGPINALCLGTNITSAAWRTKPTAFVIAADDRAIPPQLEREEAANMDAETTVVNSSHVIMLSHPKTVADVIEKESRTAN
jgi:pimeloyl-ACP methyl ester carboxylesterase